MGALDSADMIDNGSHLDVLRLLVLIQGAIAATAAVEAAVVGVALGVMWVGVLTWAGAAATFVAYRGIARRSRRARTTLRRLQYGWIALGLLDLALALFVARRGLEPVTVLVRFALPVSIIHYLRVTQPADASAAPMEMAS
jgi:hypothetical protein